MNNGGHLFVDSFEIPFRLRNKPLLSRKSFIFIHELDDEEEESTSAFSAEQVNPQIWMQQNPRAACGYVHYSIVVQSIWII